MLFVPVLQDQQRLHQDGAMLAQACLGRLQLVRQREVIEEGHCRPCCMVSFAGAAQAGTADKRHLGEAGAPEFVRSMEPRATGLEPCKLPLPHTRQPSSPD